jgi:hypothetical protein
MGGYPHPNEKENHSAGPLWGGFDHKVPDFYYRPVLQLAGENKNRQIQH